MSRENRGQSVNTFWIFNDKRSCQKNKTKPTSRLVRNTLSYNPTLCAFYIIYLAFEVSSISIKTSYSFVHDSLLCLGYLAKTIDVLIVLKIMQKEGLFKILQLCHTKYCISKLAFDTAASKKTKFLNKP